MCMMLQKYKTLPRSVFVIFFAHMVNALGQFVRPFLTLLLTEKFGFSTEKAGYLVMIATVLYVPGALLGGRLTDKLGRKKVYLLASAISAVALFLGGFSLEKPSQIVNLLLISNFALAVAAPASTAMIADLTRPENRKEAYSLLYLGNNIGFAVGPALAGFLFRHYIQLIFWGDALTTLLALSFVLLWVPESLPKHDKTDSDMLPANERFERGNTLSVLWKRPVLLLFSFIAILFSFVYSQHIFSLPIQLKELYGQDGSKYFGLLMSANAVTVVLFTTLVTSFTSRMRSTVNIGLAGIFFALGFGMLFFVRNFLWFVVSTVVWTLGEILQSVNSRTFIADNTPASHRGRLNSVLDIISGTGFAVGPTITGSFLLSHAVREVWAVSFAISMLGAVLMYGLYFLEQYVFQKPKTESAEQL